MHPGAVRIGGGGRIELEAVAAISDALGTGLSHCDAVVVGMIFPSELGWLCFGLVTAGAGLLVRPAVRAAASEVGL